MFFVQILVQGCDIVVIVNEHVHILFRNIIILFELLRMGQSTIINANLIIIQIRERILKIHQIVLNVYIILIKISLQVICQFLFVRQY